MTVVRPSHTVNTDLLQKWIMGSGYRQNLAGRGQSGIGSCG